MQAKRRYFLLTACGFLLLVVYFGFLRRSQEQPQTRRFNGEREARNSYPDSELQNDRSWDTGRSFLGLSVFNSHLDISPRIKRQASKQRETITDIKKCQMETCFDFSLCKNEFKVYVYPEIAESIPATSSSPLLSSSSSSPSYKRILNSVRDSRYYTSDPALACVFILSIDTLDRDVLSPDYKYNIHQQFANLEPWTTMRGRNHILFNMYSGTWPDYTDDLGFDYGYAILAKASIPLPLFRKGFDISMPLLSKEHPEKGGERGNLLANTYPPVKQYTLSFKGKRYLNGIGSETRNSLYHIHNTKDIVLLTTCKHGKNWKALMDERCEADNSLYDKYDFKVLLENSTFCLVPRGRRLASYRYLEALQSACIPVLLSNDWELPFSDVIDWRKVAIWADERLLLQVPSIIRSIPRNQISAFRQQTQFLWETYFSSVEKVISTTLEIMKDRIFTHTSRSSLIWNSLPGALAIDVGFSDSLSDFPFYLGTMGLKPSEQFTAIIYATTPVVFFSAPLFRLIRSIGKSTLVNKILVIWHCDTPPPLKERWPTESQVPIHVITRHSQTINARFYPYDDIETDAILSLDEDVLITTDEMDFAVRVWSSFPERIVGYPARNHYWDDSRSQWHYTSKWTNDYSMVLTGAAVYHRYYNYLYTHHVNQVLLKTVDQSQNCDDLLMNFLVSHMTRLPPIKLTQRKQYKETMLSSMGNLSNKALQNPNVNWLNEDHFSQRQVCINTFVNVFGYMPLIRSSLRMDTMLFKDPVSNMRKKYRQIELV